jgi:hypothetical protein
MLKPAPGAEAAAPRRFQISTRSDFPDDMTPGEYFDRSHAASDVDVAQLDETSRQEYEVERATYEHTCSALMRSKRKREQLAEQDAVAQKWAERETRAGRTLWASSVPEWFMGVHGLITRTAAQVTQRPRETASRRRRRASGGGSSRDGPRRRSDDDEAEPPGVAQGGAR